MLVLTLKLNLINQTKGTYCDEFANFAKFWVVFDMSFHLFSNMCGNFNNFVEFPIIHRYFSKYCWIKAKFLIQHFCYSELAQRKMCLII